MNVKPYTYFSQLYSHLMKSVDYSFWANYIKEIHQTLGNSDDIGLELAAGDCRLGVLLNDEFQKLYLSDLSLEMLCLNQTSIPKICCNMLNLPFKLKFNFVYSAFDSINYLNTDDKLISFFNQVKKIMDPEGLLIFDVSLTNNSLKHLRKLNRKGKFKDVQYNQKSEYNELDRLHRNTIEIKMNSGKTYKEIHVQKIYDFYYYFEVLELTGFFVVECFDAFTFKNGTPGSERIQFIVKRIN